MHSNEQTARIVRLERLVAEQINSEQAARIIKLERLTAEQAKRIEQLETCAMLNADAIGWIEQIKAVLVEQGERIKRLEAALPKMGQESETPSLRKYLNEKHLGLKPAASPEPDRPPRPQTLPSESSIRPVAERYATYMDAARLACKQAASAIARIDRVQWAGFICSILEHLDKTARGDTYLRNLRDSITARLKTGRW